MPTIDERIEATGQKARELYEKLGNVPLDDFGHQQSLIEDIDELIRAESRLRILKAQFGG